MAKQFTDSQEFREGPEHFYPDGRSDKDSPTTTREQKKQGYFEIRRLKLIELNASKITGAEIIGADISGTTITGGEVQTAKDGLRLKLDGDSNSYQFLSDDTPLAELKSQTVPYSGSSGAALKHGTGQVLIEVSGQGEGLGSRQVLLTNSDASVYFGLLDTDDGNFRIIAGGLPTTDPGVVGQIWNDSGTLKIST